MRERAAVGLVCLLLAGCSEGYKGPYGADPAKTGPAGPATPLYGPGAATPTAAPSIQAASPSPAASRPTRPPRPTGPVQTMPQLASAITAAISWEQRKGNPDVRVARRKFAQYQLVISWHVSNMLGDPVAKDRAAQDAVTILQLIQRRNLPPFGSVLLLITAPVRDDTGGKRTTQVIRAKYTVEGVRSITFDATRIWSQTDDKPAEMHSDFR